MRHAIPVPVVEARGGEKTSQGFPVQGFPVQGFPVQGFPVQGFPVHRIKGESGFV